MATVIVYLEGQRTAKIDGCTGDPVLMVFDMSSGTYRDQFTIANDNEGLFFPGLNNDPAAIAIQVPPVVQAALVPTGNITIVHPLPSSTTTNLEASSFAIAVSDEIAHTPPRTEESQLSYWCFPTNKDGVIMFQRWRMDKVIGWCNMPPTI